MQSPVTFPVTASGKLFPEPDKKLMRAVGQAILDFNMIEEVCIHVRRVSDLIFHYNINYGIGC